MAKKNSKSIYIVALALFLGGFGYLLWSGLSQNSSYFVTVSEALAIGTGELDQARLFGDVAPDGIARHDDGMGVRFRLVDKEQGADSIWVDYSGVVPDTFKPGVEVIVEGGYDQSAGEFHASTLMTKCPSKYKKQSEEQYSQ